MTENESEKGLAGGEGGKSTRAAGCGFVVFVALADGGGLARKVRFDAYVANTGRG